MSKKKNMCFDTATLVLYKESIDGEIVIESICDAYRKHIDSSVYVCVHVFDESEHTSRIYWKKAVFCKTKSIQEVVIYLTPNEIIGSGLENENIIRVTPNHIFPVLTKNGYKNTDAYLLQTGAKLIFERCRKDAALMSDDSDEVNIKEVLAEGSEHYIDYRHIAKVMVNDIDETDFYGISLCDYIENESHYIMTCNSCISHDSSL